MNPEQYMKMLGATPEVFKAKMRDNSLKQVKVALALGKVAEMEAIEISAEELEEEYKEASEKYKTDVEKLKETAPEKDIIRDLKLRKAAKIVVDNAIVEEFKEDESSKEDILKEKPLKEKPVKEKAKKPGKKKTETDGKEDE